MTGSFSIDSRLKVNDAEIVSLLNKWFFFLVEFIACIFIFLIKSIFEL